MLKYAKIHQHRLCDYHELVACFRELCSAVGKKSYYTAKRIIGLLPSPYSIREILIFIKF